MCIFDFVGSYAGKDHEVDAKEFKEACDDAKKTGACQDPKKALAEIEKKHKKHHHKRHQKLAQAMDKGDCEAMFAYLDKNGNGQITAREGKE